jgi:hypothetical protein
METVERVLAGSLADMVFTDPPYNVNYGATTRDKLRGTNRTIANDNLGGDFAQFLVDACTNLLSVTKGAVYICLSSSELHTLQKAFREAGGHWSTFVIWAKNTFTMGRADYQRQYEPMLYGWKEGTDHFLRTTATIRRVRCTLEMLRVRGGGRARSGGRNRRSTLSGVWGSDSPHWISSVWRSTRPGNRREP